jgi:hypothetical protein
MRWWGFQAGANPWSGGAGFRETRREQALRENSAMRINPHDISVSCTTMQRGSGRTIASRQ